MNNQEKNRQWWVAGTSGAMGPYSREHLQNWINTGQLTAVALVCPTGGTEWHPARDWPDFAQAASGRGRPPPAPSRLSMAGESGITNARLPRMANWICIYCVAFVPALLVATILLSCAGFATVETSGPSTLDPSEEFLVGILVLGVFGFLGIRELSVFLLLLVGGLRLRHLRGSGVTAIKIGLWISIVTGPVVVIVNLLVAIGTWDSTPATLLEIVQLFFTLIALAAYAFEVQALVWLTSNGRFLPLDAS